MRATNIGAGIPSAKSLAFFRRSSFHTIAARKLVGDQPSLCPGEGFYGEERILFGFVAHGRLLPLQPLVSQPPDSLGPREFVCLVRYPRIDRSDLIGFKPQMYRHRALRWSASFSSTCWCTAHD